MGNHKLRLWDMMPNAWFYKLKDMGKGRDTNSINTSTSTTNSLKKKQPKPKPLPLPATTHPSKPKQSPHHNPCTRKSYYFTRELIPNDNNTLLNLPDPPRRSSKHIARRRASSPKFVSSAGCSCRATLWTNNNKSDNFPLSTPDRESSIIFPEEAEPFEPCLFPPEFRSDDVLTTQPFDRQLLSFASKSCACKHEIDDSSSDIIIDVDKKFLARKHEKQLNPFDNVSQLVLPPIVTKLVTKSDDKKEAETKKKQKDNSKELPLKIKRTRSTAAKVVKVDQHKSSSNSPGGRRHYNYSANSPGIRLRINSPRIASRRSFQHHQVQGRRSLSLSSTSRSSRSSSTTSSKRSLSASLAIVKSSFDPQRDFRDSMVEMIVENNISASKDLEDLLACYLSLNSDEYHDLIIKVFRQIWFDLTRVNLN